jgi:hypothetical protein
MIKHKNGHSNLPEWRGSNLKMGVGDFSRQLFDSFGVGVDRQKLRRRRFDHFDRESWL